VVPTRISREPKIGYRWAMLVRPDRTDNHRHQRSGWLEPHPRLVRGCYVTLLDDAGGYWWKVEEMGLPWEGMRNAGWNRI
jgi:hypothetical protein